MCVASVPELVAVASPSKAPGFESAGVTVYIRPALLVAEVCTSYMPAGGAFWAADGFGKGVGVAGCRPYAVRLACRIAEVYVSGVLPPVGSAP